MTQTIASVSGVRFAAVRKALRSTFVREDANVRAIDFIDQ